MLLIAPSLRSHSLCYFLTDTMSFSSLRESWVHSQLLTWPALISLIRSCTKTSEHLFRTLNYYSLPAIPVTEYPQDANAKSPVWKSIVFIDSVLIIWGFQHLVWYLISLANIGHVLENTVISGFREWMCWTRKGMRCFHTVFHSSDKISLETKKT